MSAQNYLEFAQNVNFLKRNFENWHFPNIMDTNGMFLILYVLQQFERIPHHAKFRPLKKSPLEFLVKFSL